jgi:hypothetical protein
MPHNLSQLLVAFDKLIISYFLKETNFDYKESQNKLTILLPQLIELSPNFLTQKLENHFINQEYEQLFNLSDFFRVMGFDEQIPIFENKKNEIVTTLLKISLSFFKNSTPDISQNPYYLFFIKTIFDIIFHQVWFSDYEPTVKSLYFELCNEILEEKYHYLDRKGEYGYYEQIIYFIELGDGKFNREELIELLPKIEKLTLNCGYSDEWIENIEERLK